MPRKYWTLAFHTTVYHINRMPTSTLQYTSPFHKIYGHLPNYQKLRSFGYLCYPYLRPFASNELYARSTSCGFVGYSTTQSAYFCLNPNTNKIYVSRHVKFVEQTFLFA